MRFRQLGLTLVEGLAFLGVAASVLVGTMALYKIADTTQKTTDLQAGLLEMRRIANEYRLGYGSYTGFTHTLVINSNRVPGGWGVDTTNGWMTHQFNNGAVVASPLSGGATYQVSTGTVPSNVCVDMALAASEWAEVRIGPNASTLTTYTVPISAANAETACTGTANRFMRYVN
ncbi:MAG: hypothetical protein BroJett012_06920 [Betaproteobacteria bacterium]|nr:MAG: hypothetical protein BroJett012_06920 [Betaproteobacteria bacterium]